MKYLRPSVLLCWLLAVAPVTVIAAADANAGRTVLFSRPATAPQPMPANTKPDPLEKQFRIDTHQSATTPRVQAQVSGRVQPSATAAFLIQPDVSAWPADVRQRARLWVAIGAPNIITSEGSLGVRFAQNGSGLETAVDNTFNVDGTIVFGCDYALADGSVTLDLIPGGRPNPVDYTVRAIVYLPETAAAPGAAKK